MICPGVSEVHVYMRDHLYLATSNHTTHKFAGHNTIRQLAKSVDDPLNLAMETSLFLLSLLSIFLLSYKIDAGSIRKVQTKPPPTPIIYFQLIDTNASPHKPIMNFKLSAVNTINLQKLGLSKAMFSIKAVANSTVKSVKFSNGIKENSPPFAYCGNNGDVYVTCSDLYVGMQKNITVIGYPKSGQQGTPFPLLWAVIKIINATVPLPPPVTAPIPAPKPATPSVPTVKAPVPTLPAPVVSAPVSLPTLPAPVSAPIRVVAAPVPTLPAPVSAPIRVVSAPAPTSGAPVRAPTLAAPAPVVVATPTVSRSCSIPKMEAGWWSTPLKPYPINVAEAQGSMIGKDFVIFSGFKNGYSMATTETYALDMSASDASWRRMDDMPFPQGLTHLGIAVVGMKAYICGGYVGGSLGTHAANCFIYDHSILSGSGKQWSSFASLPNGGRSGGGMIFDSTLNALIYAGGSQRPIQGQGSAIDYFDTWMYSFNNPNDGWVSKTNIPFHGNHMNFVTAYDSSGKERHYFFGGQDADNEHTGNTATMYEYVATTDTWIQRAPMPFPRGHSAAASRAVGCGFIVAGGRTNTGLTSDITYYDIANNVWTLVGNLPVEIHTNVCVVANGMFRCETGWAEGPFSAQRPITV